MHSDFPKGFLELLSRTFRPRRGAKTNSLLAKANTAGYTETHKTQMPPARLLGLPGKYKISHVSSQPAQEWTDMSIAITILFTWR